MAGQDAGWQADLEGWLEPFWRSESGGTNNLFALTAFAVTASVKTFVPLHHSVGHTWSGHSPGAFQRR